MSRFIDIIGLVLGVDDSLAPVQTKISGEHVAECDRQQKVRHTVVAEQLKTY
jgi:hypothetical protein